MINAINFGFVPNDITFDNAVKWNEWLAQSDNHIYFPNGTYSFLTQPNAVDKAVVIEGSNMVGTRFNRCYSSSGSFIKFVDGFASRLENIRIVAQTHSGGIGLEVQSQADGRSPDYFSLKNVVVTADNTNTWAISAAFNGVNRARQQLSGLRDCHIDNLICFCASNALILINTCHGMYMNCQTYPAWGPSSKIQFNAWADDPSKGVVIVSPVAIGALDLWNVNGAVVTAPYIYNVNRINGANVKLIANNVS